MHYQYFTSHILLVINAKGVIRQLYTPIKVMDRHAHSWVYVTEILTNEKDELFFVVNGKPLLHGNFKIVINF